MSDDMTRRDEVLRKRLVAMSVAGAPRTSRKRTVFASVAAFAVAGALTGGAVSAAALTAPDSPSTVTVEDMTWFVRDDVTLFGTPFILTGDGDMTVDLGEPPAGATELVVAFHCVDPGTVALSLGGEDGMTFGCDASDTEGANGGGSLAVADGEQTLTITADRGRRFVVWASWATPPVTPDPSFAQSAALADGTVTEAEYRDGFARYRACLQDAGYDVVFLDETGPVLEYSNTDEAVRSGAEGRCYTREFTQLDVAWQIANEYTSQTFDHFRECLLEQGITPATDAQGIRDQMAAAGIDPVECLPGGRSAPR